MRISDWSSDVCSSDRIGFAFPNADRANFPLGDMAATAQERQEPAGIRFLPTPHAHAEPGAVLKAGPRLFRSAAAFPPLRRCPAQQIFRLRKLGAVHSDQSGRDILRTALLDRKSTRLNSSH